MMSDCFGNYCRVLKPGRWMTVEFHNSRNALERHPEALQHAGFVVADVRTLDKKQGSFQQVVSGNTVKQDLIISAYKPNGGLEERFQKKAGTEEGVWDFVSTHLRQLPVFVAKGGRCEADRRAAKLPAVRPNGRLPRPAGIPVPFRHQSFTPGFGSDFLNGTACTSCPSRSPSTTAGASKCKEVEQLAAVRQRREECDPVGSAATCREADDVSRLAAALHERSSTSVGEARAAVELRTILEQNFVEDDDGSWRVPDPKKEADLEQLRHRALMKEFQQYLETKGKLKVVRTEALRAGFKDAGRRRTTRPSCRWRSEFPKR